MHLLCGFDEYKTVTYFPAIVLKSHQVAELLSAILEHVYIQQFIATMENRSKQAPSVLIGSDLSLISAFRFLLSSFVGAF